MRLILTIFFFGAYILTFGQPTCIKPVLTTSGNQTLPLSAGTATFTVSAVGQNAKPIVTDFSWVQFSGPTATLTNNDTKTVTVSFTTTGTYIITAEATDSCGAYNTHNDTLTVTASTATVVVSPNPVSRGHSIIATITSALKGEGAIYIYDSVASQVKEQGFNKPSVNAVRISVNTSRFTKGSYTLVVRLGTLSFNAIFVVD